ncbi:LTA synthase family protein [Vibrio sp. JC009]|uniref:LTA synthase family protein n=1 Tax=Vibrio sp. JC009 TaxID=2912314 RepID=UPI0023B12538|nr:LTA synthase family protein [Vibrio sp. JC009]WED22216.1 LTA synthase family protein [Vibrio sp. JC009]
MLLVFLFLIYIVKVYSLGRAFYIDDPSSYINIAISDSVIIFLCFSIYYSSTLFNQWISKLLKLLIFLISLFYILDLLIIYTFNSRFYLDDIGKYLTNLELDVVKPFYVLLISCFLYFGLTFCIRENNNLKRVWFKIITSLLLMVVASLYSVDSSVRSPFFKNYILVNLSITYKAEYSDEFVKSFSYVNDEQCGKISTKIPKNIVIFLFESWSYYQSEWFGGDKNWTPQLDKLAKENISYNNFYANGFTTEAGLYALFTGDILIPYKVGYGTDGAVGLNSIGYSSSLPNRFSKLGYITKFITSGDLNFLNKRSWLKSLGFERIMGNEIFDKKERKFLFDSVSDEMLYTKVNDLINDDNNNFIVVENVNTHQPYYYPDNGEVKISEEFAFKYADKQLSKAVHSLSEPDTMIVVMSDHRAMTPITEKEKSDSGRMAASKVPMFIVWKNKNITVENVLQQTDVLPSILNMIDGHQCISSSRGAILPTNNIADSKCVYYARGDERSKVSVMCDNNQFDVLLDGDDTRVLEKGTFEYKSVDYLNMIRIKNDQGIR